MRYVVVALAVFALAGCKETTDGHPITTAPSGKHLSHQSVEQFILSKLGAQVVCNNGKDFTMQRAGQTFRCVGGGKSFTITIKNPETGEYQVS